MNKLTTIINEEINELARTRGKDVYWRGTDKKGKMKTGEKPFAKMRDMSSETYKLRREVMNYIYEAKNLLKNKLNFDLPRQTIRIVDLDPTVFLEYEGKLIPNFLLGCATRGGNDIYIPAETIERGYDLKFVVYHELLHSAFCLQHIKGSPLMNGEYSKISSDNIDKLFLEHAKESGRV